jgi:hypothetical protein
LRNEAILAKVSRWRAGCGVAIVAMTTVLALRPSDAWPLATLAQAGARVGLQPCLPALTHLLGFAALVGMFTALGGHPGLAAAGVLGYSALLELLQGFVPWREVLGGSAGQSARRGAGAGGGVKRDTGRKGRFPAAPVPGNARSRGGQVVEVPGPQGGLVPGASGHWGSGRRGWSGACSTISSRGASDPRRVRPVLWARRSARRDSSNARRGDAGDLAGARRSAPGDGAAGAGDPGGGCGPGAHTAYPGRGI